MVIGSIPAFFRRLRGLLWPHILVIELQVDAVR